MALDKYTKGKKKDEKNIYIKVLVTWAREMDHLRNGSKGVKIKLGDFP